MNITTGKSIPLWMENTPQIHSDGRLNTDLVTDVCVVGAGISGLTTAYLLLKEGRQVVVLENVQIGGGMTGRTTAHLMSALDDRFYKLENLFGKEGSAMAAQSHRAAIDKIEKIINDEQIACDFERLDGYLFAAPERSIEEIEQEYAAASRAGFDVDLVARAPILDFDTRLALRFANQGQFHPLKYLTGLAQAVQEMGGKIYTDTHVNEVTGGRLCTVKTDQGVIVTASQVVVATNAPINNRFELPLKQAGYMTYAIGALIPRDSVSKALFWDTLEDYHYVRVAEASSDVTGDMNSAEQILIIGGEDHKAGQANDADKRYAALEQWARERFPMMKEVVYQWSGEVMEPVDSLGYIGKNPQDYDNVFIATGDSGTGMTHGTIAGILLTDLILGRANEWQNLYDPSRKVLASLSEFAKESLNTNAQYMDWLAPSDVNSVDDIPRGEGAVMRDGMKKIAVYRDEHGELHECSAACSHLAGVVHWNSSEKTWDCPCHGSRFDAYGAVIQGPASTDLAPAHQEKKQKLNV